MSISTLPALSPLSALYAVRRLFSRRAERIRLAFIVEHRDAANANVLGSLDSGPITSGAEWIQITDKRTVPAGTSFIRVRLMATRNSGTMTDVYFDQVELRALGWVGVHLSGIITDDGLCNAPLAFGESVFATSDTGKSALFEPAR